MDSTVALFFSLGLVMSGPADQESTAPASPDTSSRTEIAQKTNNKAARVQRRIALTNQWLHQQKQARRAGLQRDDKTLAVSDAGKPAGRKMPGTS